MAAVYSDALGKFGQPPLWPFHHVAESWTWLHWLPFRATPLDIKV